LSDELTGRVIAVIAKTQRLDPSTITPDSTFAELKIDSLDGINILFALEEEFKISIPDDAARVITSVRQAVDGVAQLMASGTPAAAETAN
jgi:acyl carrier protein